MSTTVDREYQQMLYLLRMNMGGRIKQRLNELGWQQVTLLDHVPELSAATLSAAIKRDSEWSRYASAIADALGVNVRWLLFGDQPKLLTDIQTQQQNNKGLLDEALLKEVIVSLEEVIEEQDILMEPEKKAEYILGFYKFYKGEGAHPTKNNLVHLVRSAA
jgi:lambda repressor-like predicted transcriptional regulator